MLSELVLCGLVVSLLISVLPLCLGDSVLRTDIDQPQSHRDTEEAQRKTKLTSKGLSNKF